MTDEEELSLDEGGIAGFKLTTGETVIAYIESLRDIYDKKSILLVEPVLLDEYKYAGKDGQLYNMKFMRKWIDFADFNTYEIDTSNIILSIPASDETSSEYEKFIANTTKLGNNESETSVSLH